MKTGIIIPCYNEEKRLNVDAYLDFIQSHDEYHLCFVNDGSKDDTLKVLKGIQERAELKVSIVDVKKNAGKAAAVRSGARYLFNRQDIDYIGFIDADLSTDFNDFKRLVDKLHKDDKLSFVYGSRGKGEGKIERNLFRNIFSGIIKLIVYLILRMPIKDTQCGAKVFRRAIIPIAYDHNFLTRWLFDVEIFIRLKKHYGIKQVMNHIHEEPLERWIHVEDSKLSLKDAMQIPYMLMSIWFSYTFIEFFTNSILAIKVISLEDIKTFYSLNDDVAA